MDGLINLIFVFFIINCLIIRLRHRQLINASNLFYIAWLIILPLSSFASRRDFIPEIDDYSIQLIFIAHVGAFFGFLAANIYLLSTPSSNSSFNHKELDKLEYFTYKRFHTVIFVLGIFGTLHLIERLASVGITSSVYSDIRLHYLENSLSTIGKLTAYLFTATVPLAILLGLVDAKAGSINVRRLISLVIVAGIHGIAMGGRGFLAGVILPYFLSLLLANSSLGYKISLRKVFKVLGIYGVVAGLVFTLLGELRIADKRNSSYSKFIQNKSIIERAQIMMVSWVGMAIPAVGPVAKHSANVEPLNGYLIYGFFTDQFEKVGFPVVDIPKDKLDFIRNRLTIEKLREKIGLLGNTPPTIIPKLVEDAGVSFMPFYLGLLMFICQIWSIRFSGAGFFRHSLACIAVQASYMTIQTYYFLYSGSYLGLLWTLLIIFYSRRLCRRFSISSLKRSDYGA